MRAVAVAFVLLAIGGPVLPLSAQAPIRTIWPRPDCNLSRVECDGLMAPRYVPHAIGVLGRTYPFNPRDVGAKFIITLSPLIYVWTRHSQSVMPAMMYVGGYAATACWNQP